MQNNENQKFKLIYDRCRNEHLVNEDNGDEDFHEDHHA
jgi:hypothetical protein